MVSSRNSGSFLIFVKIDAGSAEFYVLQGLRRTTQAHALIIRIKAGDWDKSAPWRVAIELALEADHKAFEYSHGHFGRHVLKDEYLYANLTPAKRKISKVTAIDPHNFAIETGGRRFGSGRRVFDYREAGYGI